MDIEKFIELHKRFSRKNLSLQDITSQEHREYIDAIDNNKTCADYYRRAILIKRGFADIDKHCCLSMAYQLSTALDNPDGENGLYVIIKYIAKFNEYVIPIHDGEEEEWEKNFVLISYCPWCGQKLPESKSKLWYEKLEKLGYNDPTQQDIPKDFKTDKWFR